MVKLTRLVLERLETSMSNPKHNRGGTILLSLPPLVEAACLELAEIPLVERIYQLGLKSKTVGITQIKILPLLLAPGIHVQEDIPTAVTKAKLKLGKKMAINIYPHLGTYQGIVELIEKQYYGIKGEGRILVAHGSRREKANQEIEIIAKNVDAIAAYTFISPSVTLQAEKLIELGHKTITIVPYVLFPGKLIEGIMMEMERLSQRFPEIKFYLRPPLGETSNLAEIITKLMTTV